MSYTTVSLFSGGGGLDLGFLREGFDIVWAIDSESNATKSYQKNIGDHIICADINTVDLSSIPKSTVVIGGPPCQSFSLSGNRNTEDDRGMLVWKYIEILKKIKPRAFVFENVTGLLSAKDTEGKKIFPQLKEAFREIGYIISAQVMNAVDYGVPQKRRRVIVVGLLGGPEFEFPEPTHGDGLRLEPYVTVKDALDDLPMPSQGADDIVEYDREAKTDYQKMMREGSKFISEHFVPQMSELDKYIVSHVKPGGNYMDIPKDVNSKRIRRLQEQGGHTTCYGRMSPDQPSYTINTYFNRPNVGCNIHYSQERLITVREALRLQSFPDRYEIISSSKQGRNMIVGNAVPPLLAQVIAHKLKKYI